MKEMSVMTLLHAGCSRAGATPDYCCRNSPSLGEPSFGAALVPSFRSSSRHSHWRPDGPTRGLERLRTWPHPDVDGALPTDHRRHVATAVISTSWAWLSNAAELCLRPIVRCMRSRTSQSVILAFQLDLRSSSHPPRYLPLLCVPAGLSCDPTLLRISCRNCASLRLH